MLVVWPLLQPTEPPARGAYQHNTSNCNEYARVVKHVIPGSLVRGTDLFSLRLSSKKMTAANTIAVQCE